MDVLAHYLEIEWQAPGVARRVEVSTYPIEIEISPDGRLSAEISIFRDFAPWVGLQLAGALAGVEPCTINAENERLPWLQVSDGKDRTWWIPETGWSKAGNKHVSEMHRSFGSFSVELGPRQKLVLDAVALELDRAHAQEYLDDFTDELVWLAIGRPSGALGEVGSDNSRDLLDALKGFTDAASRVLEHPAREIREVTGVVATARVRPNSETFRAVMRRPGARSYPGRTAQESADIPENRYLRGLVEHCRRLARSLTRSSAHHQAHLAARATREKSRAANLLAVERVEVDPEIFDNQLSDMRKRLDAIATWAGSSVAPEPGERQYRFTVGKEFKGDGGAAKEFFYRNPDRDDRYDEREGINFSVARLPEDLHDLVIAASRFDKDIRLDLMGNAVITTFRTVNGKLGRRATFTHISNALPHSPVLVRRETARSRYERNGWHRPIGRTEREEYRLEANTALTRAGHFAKRVEGSAIVSSELNVVANSLDQQDAAWEHLRVVSSSKFPLGTRFFQAPIYAAALAAYHKVSELEKRTGLSGDVLHRLGRINTLHASALYERWCLIKIIGILMQDFGFKPDGGWVQHLVSSISQAGQPNDAGFSLSFTRVHPSMTARFDVEPKLANGRRPDFRLRFTVGGGPVLKSDDDERGWGRRVPNVREVTRPQSGLVMDAKFRTRWKPDELPSMLRLLVDTKKYGQDGDRVFILQPAKAAIAHRTSPLGWGRDCDYGQQHPTGHAHGNIQLAADPIFGAASLTNLRRLIALQLQQVFPEPEVEEVRDGNGDGDNGRWSNTTENCRSNSTFCITCGEAHEPADVKPDRTERGNRKWYYSCTRCGTGTMQTRCFGCGTFLHKNGLQMTYHLTVADQISNVVCFDCGAGF
ncbi:hypothetical protein [Rhizobium ruizarguesonis]|uniref:hypothetical protein n=1 Tax=Rhizobium ruizarguesonis TaxID=2081791 RepID=UPI0010319A1E|nr:hypothetical protein [Rhizobium ruizarguesonis]TCB02940.1 hypothetical protein E0H65_04170 [Rhizobium leguminosarum bv. viciae]TBD31975.1 hypothetical protein ELH19_30025 [Rhizobium ruizarguesonis]TBD33043.1 hypothetical protein ELH18_27160 [Rhizobium ruizarguesonis]TBD52000.1 hypothetical protein ELH15_31935 [Rhizobium ruizarguesonis]TBD75405.1 hypothetical protein ELH14_31080 [Rhizobium ruizarguesonis]